MVHKSILWPDFSPTWPNTGPAGTIEPFSTMGPWPIPTINTALLLTSGLTLTIAHHAIKDNNRGKLKLWLAATIALGVLQSTTLITVARSGALFGTNASSSCSCVYCCHAAECSTSVAQALTTAIVAVIVGVVWVCGLVRISRDRTVDA